MKVFIFLGFYLIVVCNGSPINVEVNMTTHQVMGTINVDGHGPVTIVSSNPYNVRVSLKFLILSIQHRDQE